MILERNGTEELAAIELLLLLEAIRRWSGHDFREYAPALLRRRVAERLRAEDAVSISTLQDRVLHDDQALRRFVYAMSANPSRLFDAPDYFRAFRESVVPFLRTYSFTRLWLPACWTGADAYTIASILYEENLLERGMIYATDSSDKAIEQARAGIFTVSTPEELAADYRASGGRGDISIFADYENGKLRFKQAIRKNLIFATHSLATDASLNEFHAIIARGVLPQFNRSLQFRVHNLFLQSLKRFGFLCLSPTESLTSTPHEGAFRKVDTDFPIYRRMR